MMTLHLNERLSLEKVLDGFFTVAPRVPKFRSYAEELDAVAAWKAMSAFDLSLPDGLDDLDELVVGATQRGLRAVVVPNSASANATEVSVYISRVNETWRVEALRDLQQGVLDHGGFWTDDLVRTESRLRGYSVDDTEAWIRDNRGRTGFWSGWRRVFVGFEVNSSDRYTLGVARRFPTTLHHWWTLSLPIDCCLRDEMPSLSCDIAVVRGALLEDPLDDAFSAGDVLTFERWPEVRARRLQLDGTRLNQALGCDLDLLRVER